MALSKLSWAFQIFFLLQKYPNRKGLSAITFEKWILDNTYQTNLNIFCSFDDQLSLQFFSKAKNNQHHKWLVYFQNFNGLYWWKETEKYNNLRSTLCELLFSNMCRDIWVFKIVIHILVSRSPESNIKFSHFNSP